MTMRMHNHHWNKRQTHRWRIPMPSIVLLLLFVLFVSVIHGRLEDEGVVSSLSASFLDVHLHSSTVRNAVIVALNDTTTTTTSCPAVAELFPDDTILLTNYGTMEWHSSKGQTTTKTSIAVITVIDLQTQRLCSRQRGRIIYEHESTVAEDGFRVTTICAGCDQQGGSPFLFHGDPMFVTSQTSIISLGSRDYHTSQNFYFQDSESLNANEGAFRIQMHVSSLQIHWTVHRFDIETSINRKLLQPEYGIGPSESGNHPLTRTASRLPITTGVVNSTDGKSDTSHTSNNTGTNGRQSDAIAEDDRCLVPFNECCKNKDCLNIEDTCVHRNCIDNGILRITLKWVGDDDLDLYVVTPEGVEISFQNFFDPISQGRFGEDSDQQEYGYHVENVYFPAEGAPAGRYTYSVRPLITVDTTDQWTVDVVEEGNVVLSNSGYGTSPSFEYFRQQPGPTPNPPASTPVKSPSRSPLGIPVEETPTPMPGESPLQPPTIPPDEDENCSQFSNECCIDDDCPVSTTMCIQRTCISDGNPRITLVWDGDDDLDLYVRTPSGGEISADATFDEASQGRFEMDVDQSFFGPHVESVFFPLLGAASGDYEYGVRSHSQRGASDQWFLEVSEGGSIVETQAGTGSSMTFSYFQRERIDGPERPQPGPPDCSPTQDECCESSDCPTSQVCVQRICANEGSLRVTLEWIGDDDYDLFVETPAGGIISKDSFSDPETGGNFGDTPPQISFGFQLEYVYFPSSGAPLGTYHVFVKSVATRGVGADVWKIQIYEYGELVQQESGIGDSREYPYQRVSIPIPPSIPSSPTPSDPNPAFPTKAPNLSVPSSAPPGPGERGCPAHYLCCDTTDCSDAASSCIQRTCIITGALSMDLTWTGDDNLSLVVLTPLENAISAQNPLDPASGGLFQNDPYQPDFGFHIESVVFPDSPSSGTYSFFVKATKIVGDEDRWTLKVYDSNQLATFAIGTGDSRTLSYDYQQGDTPSEPPVLSPSIVPIPPAIPTPSVPSSGSGECGGSTCQAGIETCVQSTCVSEGNPRITLQWIGNDDLNLVVVTPDGTSISADFPFDVVSGGNFELSPDDTSFGMQEGFGKHQENIVFPLSGGPVGVYRYYVTTPQVQGSEDSWILSVSIGGMEVEIQQGSGASDVFVFRYLGGIDPPGSQPGECSASSECLPNQMCVAQSCIEEGTPAFVLAYSGDDDLDLYVITPIGTTIYSHNRNDVPSGGKFSDNGSGDGVQDSPGNYIEYVYFAPNPGPLGAYQYYVETFRSTNEDDVWTITVYISGQIVEVQSGQGSSEVFIFDFDSIPVPTISPNLPPSEASCNNVTAECCEDDACFPNEACTFETCVDEGNPRFTLVWEGENDLDLLVQTPLGSVVSFSNADDSASGGKFGEEFDQFTFGRHVENIYFPMTGGPLGEYSIFVRSFLSDGIDDEYTIRVHINGISEFSYTGTGNSDGLTFMFQGVPAAPTATPLTTPPAIGPPTGMNPTQPPQINECDPEVDECCKDTQCMTGAEVCTQRTCIDIGRLRFTLQWTGDDDLDLAVVTPLSTTISFSNPLDEATGGIFGEGGTQNVLGLHVENIYFNSPSIPSGEYFYNVSSFESRGTEEDHWSVSVFLNNALVDVQNGTGNSETYTFILEDGDLDKPPNPECNASVEECCIDQDCSSEQVCALNVCINKGSPRFTLEYVGDDQIDLTVVTPIGTTLSLSNPEDGSSTGRFEDGGDALPGKRVQNIYFSEGPGGIYTYFISTFDQNGDPDEWTIYVYEGDVETVNFVGSGNADFLYEFAPSSTPPSATAGAPEPTDPNVTTPSSSPVLACQTSDNECCADDDCSDGAVCRSRSCISDGNLRFSLLWQGPDDYDLSVTTPFGGTISFLSQLDEETGGRFGDNTLQALDGFQVENVYFPDIGAPFGDYNVEIASFSESGNGESTTWTLEIAVGGVVAQMEVGTGSAGPIIFEYSSGDITRAAVPDESVCVKSADIDGVCCGDADCITEIAICVSNTCIQSNGRLRFTLTWDNNEGVADDLDLVVTPPEGNEREKGAEIQSVGDPSHRSSGSQIESVSFPMNSTIGTYRLQVKSFVTFGEDDPWVLQVFLDGTTVSEPFSGRGTSEEMTFNFLGDPSITTYPESTNNLTSSSATGTDAFDPSTLEGNNYGIGNGTPQGPQG